MLFSTTTPMVERVEAVNALTRAGILMLLAGAFSVAFLYGVWAYVRFGSQPLITAGEFIGALSVSLTWFFKSRDEKATRDAMAAHPPASNPMQESQPRP